LSGEEMLRVLVQRLSVRPTITPREGISPIEQAFCGFWGCEGVVGGDCIEVCADQNCDSYYEDSDNFPGPGGTQHRLILVDDTQVRVTHDFAG
jgi:hypothetical protein